MKKTTKKQIEIRKKQAEQETPTPNINTLTNKIKSYTIQQLHKIKDKDKKIQRKQLKKYPEKIVLIHIHLANGQKRMITLMEQEQGFTYRGQKYIFDNISKKYNIDAKLWEYTFHEKLSIPVEVKTNKNTKEKQKINLPIDQEIPVENIREIINESGIYEIEYATNPSLLHKFMQSDVIKMLLKGVDLDKIFKFLKIMSILTVLMLLAIIIFLLYNSGLFAKGGA